MKCFQYLILKTYVRHFGEGKGELFMYEKPIVLPAEDIAEGVYMASGATSVAGNGELKCDSIYMKGIWQGQDTSPWAQGETRGYKQVFGCLGCPAHTANGCGLQTHYVDSDFASSYEADNGNRKPTWERKGYGPDDAVTDWSVG